MFETKNNSSVGSDLFYSLNLIIPTIKHKEWNEICVLYDKLYRSSFLTRLSRCDTRINRVKKF